MATSPLPRSTQDNGAPTAQPGLAAKPSAKASRAGKTRPADRGASPAASPIRSARWVAVVLYGLAVVILMISMPHLAAGARDIAQCATATSLFVAVVFDLSQLGAEASLLVGRFVGLSRRSVRMCRGVILCATGMSCCLNVRAFIAHAASTTDEVLAVIWGLMLPIGVLTLFSVASDLLIVSSAAAVIAERDDRPNERRDKNRPDSVGDANRVSNP